MGFLSGVCRRVLGAVYPPYCTVCGGGLGGLGGLGCDPPAVAAVWGAVHLCGECAGAVRCYEGAYCRRCSRRFEGRAEPQGCCAECLVRKPAFACAVAPYRLRGVLREVVHQFKYQGKEYLRLTLAEWMAVGLGDPRLRAPPPEVLVPVPLHWRRELLRGFNQAELLARALVRGQAGARGGGGATRDVGCGLAVEQVLRRVRDTGTQTALGGGDRRGNMRGAFAVRVGKRGRVAGRHVLLVDDVLTTGATLDACARALLLAGAASVRALLLARG